MTPRGATQTATATKAAVPTPTAALPAPVPAIAGGFLRVAVAQVHRAWQLCRAEAGGATDFRAWLATREMIARRGVRAQGVAPARGSQRRPTFGVAELARLCALSERRALAAARQLNRLGLLDWDLAGGSITVPAAPLAVGAATEVERAHPLDDSLAGRSGMATLPRRLVRFLARGARPALIATALGVVLRCVSRRRAGWSGRGRVKASWIAATFGVDARRVKAARADLIQLGWLATAEGTDPQWAWNRWGRAFVVDLAWSAPASPATTTTTTTLAPTASTAPRADCHPSPPATGAELPPPDLHLDPVPEKQDPEPGSARPTGVGLAQVGDKPTTPDRSGEANVRPASQPASKPAALSRIAPEDLTDLDRTLALYAAAVRAGWVVGSEAARLRFVAATVHACGVGATNPPGLFRAIVQGQRWHLLTQADEDRARRGLRQHDQPYAARPQGERHPQGPTRPGAVAVNPLGTLLDRFAPRLAGLAPPAAMQSPATPAQRGGPAC